MYVQDYRLQHVLLASPCYNYDKQLLSSCKLIIEYMRPLALIYIWEEKY